MKRIFPTIILPLILITILAGVLRFYKLGEIPSSINWDEAAQGYNAFSLGIDSRDEFGRVMPLDYLESFGDFKPVAYTYAAIIPVKIWGLNEFSIRFPSALFGTLTVFLTFFLVRRLFFQSLNKDKLALITAFIIAVSPWHIQLSRAAFEANLGLFEVVLGMWLLLKGFNESSKYIVISALPFSAVFYTFNSTRAFIPLFLPVVFLFYLKKWKSLWPQMFAFVMVFSFCLTAVTPHLLSPQASLRFKEVNIFTDPAPVLTGNQRIAFDNNKPWAKILHNRRFMYSLEFMRHYLDNLNLRFLFLSGDPNPKFSIQDVGQEYLIWLPFFILGIFWTIRKYPPAAKIIFPWLLIGIIPAATARETPHALRILQTLPMWQILIAVGLWETSQITENLKKYKMLVAFCLLLIALNFFYYLHDYYAHYDKEYVGEWQYGYKPAISYAQNHYQEYDRIAVTDVIGRPYIYVLFYTKAQPLSFRYNSGVERDSFGFVKVNSYDKYIFGGHDIEKPLPGKKTLYILSADDKPDGKIFLENIFLPNGKPILSLYED